MGMSQMCTGAGDYFKTSEPHSEKLCIATQIEMKYLFIFLSLSFFGSQFSSFDEARLVGYAG